MRISRRWPVVAAVLLAMFVAACGFDDQRPLGRTVAVLHPGYSLDVAIAANRIIDESAENGDTLRVWVLTSSSASVMQRVSFGAEAMGGDFRGTSQNELALKRETGDAAEAARADLTGALGAMTIRDEGADLLGALENLLDEIERIDDKEGPATIYVVSGGAIHRTAELDLADPALRPADWAGVIEDFAERIEEPAIDGVQVEILGIGNYTGSSTSPAGAITDITGQFWADVCTALNERGIECFKTSSLS